MTGRSASRLAWGIWAISILALAGPIVFAIVGGVPDGSEQGTWLNYASVVLFIPAFATVGAVLASRRPSNPMGWLLSASALLYSAGTADSLVKEFSIVWKDWMDSWVWGLAIALTATFVLLLFPTGSLPSRRWKPVAWASGAAMAAFALGNWFAPGVISETHSVNPMGIGGPLGSVFRALRGSFAVILPLALLSVVSLVFRYRRAPAVEREQLKWLVYAAGVILAVNVTLSLIPGSGQFAVDVKNAIVTVTVALIPVSIGIAVLRYRLYDIDVVINKTLVYGLLTGSLALVYASLVLGLGGVARSLGASSQSPLVVAASTLTAAALFRPLRRRVQAFIDRRFYRKRYDAQRALEAFAATLRNEVDLELLRTHLLDIVGGTIQPTHATVWLRAEVGP